MPMYTVGDFVLTEGSFGYDTQAGMGLVRDPDSRGSVNLLDLWEWGSPCTSQSSTLPGLRKSTSHLAVLNLRTLQVSDPGISQLQRWLHAARLTKHDVGLGLSTGGRVSQGGSR